MVYTPVDELPTPPPAPPRLRWTDERGQEWQRDQEQQRVSAEVARRYVAQIRAHLPNQDQSADHDPTRAAAIARARAERQVRDGR